MAVGIDALAFYTPAYWLDLRDLANARGDDPDKYTIGIGQEQQAVLPPDEDVVTLAANAAQKVVTAANRAAIDHVIVATESGIDHSKSVAIYVHHLLDLPAACRTVELKQACYAGTYGLMQARDYVAAHPDKKVLVIAADIARYGLRSAGEVTQGAGAVAMLVSADPSIAVINDDTVFMSEHVMDFWRPLDRSTALVDGHYSTETYKRFFRELWQRWSTAQAVGCEALAGFVCHLPYTKMATKAVTQVLTPALANYDTLLQRLQASQQLARRVGNLYTGSAYLSLLSVLTQVSELTAGDRVAIFSYGSGAEAELFTVTLVPGFRQALPADTLSVLDRRQQLDLATYEAYFKAHDTLVSTVDYQTPQVTAHGWRFLGITAGQRQYGK